jgi:hypothetical protein
MAANRMFWPSTALQKGIQWVHGSFAPNGAGAVDATSRLGIGFTVARTGVGVFVVTLDAVYRELVSADVAVQLNAFADTDALLGPISLSARTVTIFVKTAGVAADIAANANNRLHFSLALRSTSATPVRGP